MAKKTIADIVKVIDDNDSIFIAFEDIKSSQIADENLAELWKRVELAVESVDNYIASRRGIDF